MLINVLGRDLRCCCREPLAGFYRGGYCRTGLGDGELHTIWARMSEELLNFSYSRGNDLITPRSNFPGLNEADRWCVCVTGWKEALEAGVAPPEDLEATHSYPLEFANLESCRRTRYPLIDLYFLDRICEKTKRFMLKNIDLSREVAKAEYKRLKGDADLKLAALQRQVKALGIPVVVVFEGWSAAGKGTLINELILPLDPRGFTVHSASGPTEEEAFYPFLWRFWKRTPTRGRLAIFDRSWNRRVVTDRVEGQVEGKRLRQAFEDIRSFERQLADEGVVIVKCFLHISKKEQKRRFDTLHASAATAWRVTEDDRRQHQRYAEYLAVAEDMLTETDADYAPWTVVEAHDRRFATLKIFATVIDALERGVAAAGRKADDSPTPPSQPAPAINAFKTTALDHVDLSLSLTPEEYVTRLKKAQAKLRELEHQIYLRRVPVVIAYEGWDAAGKGGNIRRLTQNLDPRGYEVAPVAAPNDVEKAHHYLWRFWAQMPKAGHITIFDRTWYGRVLVERVEGFCTEAQWRRAYREINGMEQQLVHFGTVLLKFWLHIDPDEQLRRFRERQEMAHKQWKITDEDWRNREKLDQYRDAVEEMLHRTTTPHAPWTIVESNCKRYARVKVLETVCEAIRQRLE